jgi:hypothetical protein
MCEWDDASRVRALKERISVDLKKLVTCQVTQPDCSAFTVWVKMIHQLAVNQESMEQSHKGNNHNNGYQGSKTKDIDVIDVDSMNLNATKIYPQERERQYNEGLCYKFGQTGHVPKACSNSTRTNGVGRGRGGGGRQQRGGRGNGGNGDNGGLSGKFGTGNGAYEGYRGYGNGGQFGRFGIGSREGYGGYGDYGNGFGGIGGGVGGYQ